MSFRGRLTSFFVVIVLLPMVAIGLIVFRLIGDSSQARSNARANGLLAATASLYRSEQGAATAVARTIALELGPLQGRTLSTLAGRLAVQRHLAALIVVRDGRTLLRETAADAVAPGTARANAGPSSTTVTVSLTHADQFARAIAAGNAIVIRQGRAELAAVPAAAAHVGIPSSGNVTISGAGYDAASGTAVGLGARPVELTVLSLSRATASPGLDTSRALAAAFIAGFLVLALAFALLASRGLERQLSRFLVAARRLASGDFTAPVPVEGNDEFAMLATEFNRMSDQLAERLEQLAAERGRLRESLQRAGRAFASNLDRDALRELALKTAVDAADGEFGRLSARANGGGPLSEVARERSLEGVEQGILAAEQAALDGGDLGSSSADGTFVVSVPLGPATSTGLPHGLVTVGRRGRPFSGDDLDLLRALGGQTALALENVELHEEARRQAVTDKLTGLANHGRFQEVLSAEMEQVRRYRYPVGLIMLDIDNFKHVNDTFGHPQGDRVLEHVAQILRETSREADAAARYGGEELALILPHTDLEGSYAIAERVRVAIEALSVPRLDGPGVLRVTASLGVGATTEGDKEALIASVDIALYQAKRTGKNRTVQASAVATRMAAGE